jgi:hypothetical protein
MAGVSSNSQPGFGRQLSKRVASGAITQRQATQTARQRRTLKATYGDDWRTKVYGQGGAKGIGGPFASRIVASKRAEALTKAKPKKPTRGKRVRGVAGAQYLQGETAMPTPGHGPTVQGQVDNYKERERERRRRRKRREKEGPVAKDHGTPSGPGSSPDDWYPA